MQQEQSQKERIKYSLPNTPLVARTAGPVQAEFPPPSLGQLPSSQSYFTLHKSPLSYTATSESEHRMEYQHLSGTPSYFMIQLPSDQTAAAAVAGSSLQAPQSVSWSDLTAASPPPSISESSGGISGSISAMNDYRFKRRSTQQEEYSTQLEVALPNGMSSPSLNLPVVAEADSSLQRKSPMPLFSTASSKSSYSPKSDELSPTLYDTKQFSPLARVEQQADYDANLVTHIEKDEFFRVVGVAPTAHGTSSRVVVYVAPASNIRPVAADTVSMVAAVKNVMNNRTKAQREVVQKSNETTKSETILRENIVKLDTSRLTVRFSTNDVNEKIVKGEWKGRARKNEIYGSRTKREIVKFASSSSDKSGFVPFNTLCKAQKMQSLYLVSDLREAGLFNGALIHSLAWKISDVPDRPLENFRIAYKWTNEDSVSEFQEGLELVHGPVNLRHTAFANNDWLSFRLHRPIEWNGSSNLLVEISKDESHASFSWPASGGIFFRSTASIRTIGQKDNNDSSGQYPFTNWQKPTRFRKVPSLILEVQSPPCFKIVCVAPLSTFNNSLVNVEVAIDGHKYSKQSATFTVREIEPIALNKLTRDLSKLLESNNEALSKARTMTPFSDVLIKVGGELGHPVNFFAHSIVLCARSSAFQKSLSVRKKRVKSAEQKSISTWLQTRHHSKSFVGEASVKSLDDDAIVKLKRSGSSFFPGEPLEVGNGILRPSNSDDNLNRNVLSPESFAVNIPDIRPEVFYTLLRFIYTGTVEIELETACELFATAIRYEVQDLKQSTEEFLKQSVNIENVTWLLLASEKWKVQSIRSFCLDFVLWHFDAVSRTDGFARDVVPKHELMREILLSRRSFFNRRAIPTDVNRSASSQMGSNQLATQAQAGNTQLPTRIVVNFPISLLHDLGGLIKNSPSGESPEELIKQANNFDLVFVVGEDVVERPEYFGAHRVLLSSRCEVFEAMFLRSNMRESTESFISIPNISPTVFACVLEYLYTSKCQISYENIFELYRAADQYVLDDLKQSCEEFVMQEITIDNVAQILTNADRWSIGSVKAYCLDLATREFDEVSVTPGFLNEVVLRHDLLLEILQNRSAE